MATGPRFCFYSWSEGRDVCRTRKTIAYSISDDATVIAGETTFSDFFEGVAASDGAIFTPSARLDAAQQVPAGTGRS